MSEEYGKVTASGSLTAASVPPEVMRLAQTLSRVHGPVRIAEEASGIHIYLPDPGLLAEDGPNELVKMHLAINAEKYLGIGRYDIDTHPGAENQKLYNTFRKNGKEVPCAVSMKTKEVYSVEQLKSMIPIHVRMRKFKDVKPKVVVGAIEKYLVQDEHGVMVPQWVGHTIPLTSLPDNHPAIEYLVNRGYNPARLEHQFEACYCDSASRPGSPLPGGMANSAQGRIILSVRMNGSRVGYQCRLIDKVVGGNYYVWSNRQQWELIRSMGPDGEIRHVYEPTEQFPKGFDPHKYINALGSKRNELLMGFDAAVEYNSNRPKSKRFCVLVEGPLDAGKLGVPAIAVLGNKLSAEQAAHIRREFGVVCTVMDNDSAGAKLLQDIERRIQGRVGEDIVLPKGVKDAGDLTYEQAGELLMQCDPLLN